jgi:aspartate aminotransferase
MGSHSISTADSQGKNDAALSKGCVALRLQGVSESATLRLNSLVQKLRAQGEDIVNLTTGEPDFDIHPQVKQAAIQAIQQNKSKYTAVAGILELRERIAARTNAQQPTLAQSQAWTANHCVVTNGAKQAIFNALLALVDPSDDVLIPAPYWLSYPEMVKLVGGKPRVISTSFESGYRLDPSDLEAALTQALTEGRRPRVLLLNSPSNPTGSVHTKADFEAIGELLLSHPAARDLWVVSDEIYDRIVLGERPFCSFLEACPSLRDRTITVNGLSKSAAMTGWRIGWSVAPEQVQTALITVQGQSTSGVNSVAQWASVAALNLPEESFAYSLSAYRERRAVVLEILAQSGRIRVFPPEGAFYAWVDVRQVLREGEDAVGFAERLLQDGKVAFVPGEPFGGPGFVRLSFANALETLREGCTRFVRYLERSG